MQLQTHDFPVSLQPVFTREGMEAPRVRAVVREDTKVPIATVSTKYKLIPHADVLKQADQYMQRLGTPTTRIDTARNGATMVAEYTYRDKTLQVSKGDVVGLRLFARNSYNGTTAVKLSIGALVLKCMNGMVMPHDVFSLSVKHVGEVKFEFPDPEMIMDRFNRSVGVLKRYNEMELTPVQYLGALEEARACELISHQSFDKIDHQNLDIERPTVWGLYNDLTWDVTHQSKAGYVSKINKFNRIARWVDEKYGVIQ